MVDEPAEDVKKAGSKSIAWPLFLVTCATFASFFLLIAVWPKEAVGDKPPPSEFAWMTMEIRLMLIVLISGACGASIHTAQSFAYFRGIGKFDENWNAWYWLRIPTGMGLAQIFYFVLRAGLFSGLSEERNVNPFGFAALAGLTGMFAKQATAKLEEIFDNLFQLSEAPQPAAPVILSFDDTVKVGAKDNELVINANGSGFTSETKVFVNGAERKSAPVNSTELIFTLQPADVKKEGKLLVTVKNGQKESKPLELMVLPG